MSIKYKGASGRVVSEEELKKIFEETHPNSSDIEFDIWLYLGIDCGAIKVVEN